MVRTVRDEITYPCPHFKGCNVEVLVLSSFLGIWDRNQIGKAIIVGF